MTFCMNVSRFMNLAAIFSLDLESQFSRLSQRGAFASPPPWMGLFALNHLHDPFETI